MTRATSTAWTPIKGWTSLVSGTGGFCGTGAIVSLGGKDGAQIMRDEDGALRINAPNGIDFITDSIKQNGKQIRASDSNDKCDTSNVGSMRFNKDSGALEACTGEKWSSSGGGSGMKEVGESESFECGDYVGLLTNGKDIKICAESITSDAPLEAAAVITNEVNVRNMELNTLIDERLAALQGGSGNFVCQDGWTGFLCGEDVDDCNPNPCRNAVECQDKGNLDYLCVCQDGWTGDKCDADLQNCDSTSCSGHGTCAEDGDGTDEITCACDAGFKNNANDPDLCDACEVTNALTYSAGCTVATCATHYEPSGETCVDCNGVVDGPGRELECGCDDAESCLIETHEKDGWMLIGITNGAANGNCGPDVTQDVSKISGEFSGEYIFQPTTEKTFTNLKMDCGCTDNGVKGTVEWSGIWKYGGATDKLINEGTISLGSEDMVWIPDIIGYDSDSSDSTWHTHVGGVHYPNFGANFGNINPDQGGWRCARYVFTCDPQDGSFGNGDTRWTSCGGTQFVRLWMKPQ